MEKSHNFTRAERKAKKRKIEDAIPDIPGDEVEALDDKSQKKRKWTEGKHVKEKKGGNEDEAGEEINTREMTKWEKTILKEEQDGIRCAAGIEQPAEEVPKKSKKERKAERKAKEVAEAAAASHGHKTDTEVSKAPEVKTDEDINSEKKNKKKHHDKSQTRDRSGAKTRPAKVEGGKADARFICFVGNLPYSATKDSLQKHFASVKPVSIRLLTKKHKPTESKGCAFVEFEGYDHMKTCLKFFHHTIFEDGVSAPRKINVELTAGGGGNTQERRQKIEGKNQKLNEERFRRIQEEGRAKLEKKGPGAIDESAIHPSRRARVQR